MPSNSHRPGGRAITAVLSSAVIAAGVGFLTFDDLHTTQPAATSDQPLTPVRASRRCWPATWSARSCAGSASGVTPTQMSPYLPVIQISGAGTAHVVVSPRTGQAHAAVDPRLYRWRCCVGRGLAPGGASAAVGPRHAQITWPQITLVLDHLPDRGFGSQSCV